MSFDDRLELAQEKYTEEWAEKIVAAHNNSSETDQNPGPDLVSIPMAVVDEDKAVVVGHIFMKRAMAEMFDLWDLFPRVTEDGLVYFAIPKSQQIEEE